MIKFFKSKETDKIWKKIISRKLPIDIQNTARRKLRMFNNAGNLTDLKIPPRNKLEQLKGKRKGQYSIRINDQWIICFKWLDNDCCDIEITDYH